jgi:hypothetical protein
VGKVTEVNDGTTSGDGMVNLQVGSGNGGAVGFFRSQAFFPPAPRCAPPSIGWYSGDIWTWEQLRWVGEAEEAEDGTASGDGMSDPHFEEDHPNHSSSYVNFSVFFNFLQ